MPLESKAGPWRSSAAAGSACRHGPVVQLVVARTGICRRPESATASGFAPLKRLQKLRGFRDPTSTAVEPLQCCTPRGLSAVSVCDCECAEGEAALRPRPQFVRKVPLHRVPMLYADKRNLEVSLQVAMLRIRDKELVFYTENLMAIGTQAALMSGFAYMAIIMTAFPPECNTALKVCFLCSTTAAMSLELMTVGGSMIAAIYGPGLALRGPDGSMHRAVDGMVLEYKLAFLIFVTGLGLFIMSSFFFGLIQFSFWISLPMSGGMVYFSYDLYKYFRSIYDGFGLNVTVSGKFEFDAKSRLPPRPVAAS